MRFGIAASALFATVTTDASCGAVNSMHDSFNPLGGLVPLVNIQLGEVIFGGVGAGLYGMLVFVVLSVFIAGLMVGRTPEYLGKKIESREMKLAMLYVLIFPLIILGFSAWASVTQWGTSSLNNAGPHGLSEMLYAFSSGAGNNGSAFAGLNANTPWYNTTLGLTMLAGRFLMIIPALAIAGAMVGKKVVPAGPGHVPHQRAAVHLPPRLGGPHRRRADLLPRAVAGPHRRALRRPGRKGLLTSWLPTTRELSLFDPSIVRPAVWESFRKLSPREVIRNPVMFVVEVGALLTTIQFVRDIGAAHPSAPLWFTGLVSLWLWFTVLFANFAEAVAEGRGKAQAASLRKMRKEVEARKLVDGREEKVAASTLRKGDTVVVEAGQYIPGDGEVIEGIASVDESAITGESAPVIRESGGDRSAVTGGHPGALRPDRGPDHRQPRRVLPRPDDRPGRGRRPAADAQRDRPAHPPGGADRGVPLRLREPGAARASTAASTSPPPRSSRSWSASSPPPSAGCSRRSGSPAWTGCSARTSSPSADGRWRRPATWTRCSWTRPGPSPSATGWPPSSSPWPGCGSRTWPTPPSSPAWPTRPPRAGASWSWPRSATGSGGARWASQEAHFVPFSAQTRMSGVDLGSRVIRKGAVDAVARHVESLGGKVPEEAQQIASRIGDTGGTPLAVSEGARILGIIHLKDVVKGGIKERFDRFRAMGIRTVMITGDNPRTAAAIAREAGVDDFLAEATPEAKMRLIREEQAKGKLVAMTGDGTNDAPALAQADVGVAMNTGTQAAKEAGNMVDLDSNPTKLLEVVEVGKQLLMTRGTLTTFSIANDVAKYFAILPALFVGVYPEIAPLNVMRLASPYSAVLSAVIFNALIIIALIPLALRGVRYRPVGAAALLQRSLLIYGVGGVIVPFIGIKLVDLVVAAFGLV